MTHSVQIVFLVAVPIAFVAFLLSFLLPEVELRKTVETVDLGEVHGVARARGRRCRRSSWPWTRMSSRENRAELYQTLAQRAGHRPAAPVGLAAVPAVRTARVHRRARWPSG